MQRILVTTDFSDESKRAFPGACALAQALGLGIHLVHAVLEFRATPHGAPLAPTLEDPESSGDVREAEAKLAQQLAEFGDLDVTTEVLQTEDIAQAIADRARDGDIRMIAISTHGRTGIRRFILGSIAEEVVRRSPVPVVSYPTQGE